MKELKTLSKINSRILLYELVMKETLCNCEYLQAQKAISKMANLKIIIKYWNDAQFN